MNRKEMSKKAKAERKMARTIQDTLLSKDQGVKKGESQRPAGTSEK